MSSHTPLTSVQRVPVEEAFRIASEGYVFGYPLVLMDVTRRMMSNFSRVCQQGAPINQFLHRSEFREPSPATVPKTCAEMICSTAWLDLAKEPLILSLPDLGKRYHMMQIIDAWTNVFASPGTRTIGNARTYFAITGPHWKGPLPLGLRHIKSPTNLVFLVGRTQVNGHADCAVVRKIQTYYKLAPLCAWDRTYFPPDTVPVDQAVDMTISANSQVARMESIEFFERLTHLLRHNPAGQADAPMVAKLATIGISPDAIPLESSSLAMMRAIRDGVEHGRSVVESAAKRPEIMQVNGWAVSTNTGRYGADYLRRAAMARSGFGANVPEDAIYLRTIVDSEGHKLTGESAYVLHFSSKKTPPVKAFWSLTLYDAQEGLVENSIRRHCLSGCDPLIFNPDGSLDLYIQHEPPHRQLEANWLPAPAGAFNLVLRLYWPKSDVWEGRWVLPAVRPANTVAAVAA